MNDNYHAHDIYNLHRFVQAQEGVYESAVKELQMGRKSGHWMWYIFPQLRGLGRSSTSERYGISGADEASAYLNHTILGARLITVCETVLQIQGRTATEIFGQPDDMKLHSCATLFKYVSPQHSVFDRLLLHYFDSQPDRQTLRILGEV